LNLKNFVYLNFFEMRFWNESSHERVVIGGIADSQLFRRLYKLVDEIGKNGFFDEYTRCTKTNFTLKIIVNLNFGKLFSNLNWIDEFEV